MPSPKRWFYLSHEINDDPEVWELTDEFGDRSLRLWLEILSAIDKTGNRWRLSGQWLAGLSRKVRQTPATVWPAIRWMVAKGWLVIAEQSADGSPTVLTAPKYRKYNKSSEQKREHTAPDVGSRPSSLLPFPSLAFPKDKNKTPPASAGESADLQGSADQNGKKISADSRVDQFWLAYPVHRRRSKGNVEKAFAKIRPNEELMKLILAKLEEAKKSEGWMKDGGQYVPLPATWLNAKGWLDEYTPSGLAGPKRLPL